jgi:hypothetical protein
MGEVRGVGRSIFAAVLLTVGGVLNVIYGIAAIGNSKFFVGDAHYVFSDLHTWGWIALILGVLEIVAALVRDHGRMLCRHQRTARPAGLSVLVDLRVRAQPLDHSRADRVRRTRMTRV